ncbi:MAG: ribonuclease J [Chloroflexota bacterium]
MAGEPTIKVVPLGGVGEVGKNSTAIEFDGDIILVDAGVMFPEESMHGIDLVIPDFSYVLDNFDRLRAVVLTHGHDDHIGAVSYLLQQLPDKIPVYGTALTLGMTTSRARELHVLEKAELITVRAGDSVSLGKVTVEFFHVAHSIPDATGLIFHTPAGILIHTGDFKLDPTPVNGQPTDLARLAEVGKQGVLVLLSDSVRAEQPGRTPSERIVGETLDRIIGEATGRVIVTTFASNITRLEQVIKIAEKHGRKVAVAGRSMAQNLQVAKDLKYVDLPPSTVVDLARVRNLPRDQVVLLTTGSQGEPTSVLARIAADDHPQIHIDPADTVIIAANPVPGNEETVARTIDNLFRRGAKVIYGAVAEGVHVSGHASREELREVIRTVRPKYAVPMHGEYRHMIIYQALAALEGVPEANVLLPEVGDILSFSASEAKNLGRIEHSGSVLVDGLSVGGVTQAVLRERNRLAADGVLIAALVVDRETGQLLSGPDLIARGFGEYEGDELLEGARDQLVQSLERLAPGQAEYGFIVSKVRDSLGKYIYQQTHRRPMILPVVTEL